jgi:hypothetical protein
MVGDTHGGHGSAPSEEVAMTILTDATRFRRLTAGVSLVGFSALLVVDEVVDSSPSTPEDFYRAAVAAPAQLYASAALLLVSAALTVPAAYGIVHQARRRGAVLAHLGGGFALLGALGHTAIATLYVAMMALGGGDRGQMLAYAGRLLDGTPAATLLLPCVGSFSVGMALLSWAAWRAGLTGLWGPVLVTLAALSAWIPSDLDAVGYAAIGALAVVTGAIGVRTLRLADGDWDAAAVPEPATSGVTAARAG